MIPKPEKFVFIKRDDGTVFDVPEKHLAATLKRHPTWKAGVSIETNAPFLEAPITENTVEPPRPKDSGFFCPICGKEFTSEKLLQNHKKYHDKR